MRSTLKIDIHKAYLKSILEQDQLVTLWDANATIAASMGVSFSQPLIRVRLITLRFARQEES